MAELDFCIEFKRRNLHLVKCVGDTTSVNILTYIERNCYSNCLVNCPVMQKIANCPLKIVCGSLGLCDPPPVWFEWGGFADTPHQTVKQFNKCPFTGLPDVHYWLENEGGKVWDVLDIYLTDTVAPFQKKCIASNVLPAGHLIPGMTYDELKGVGLMYVPAEPLVQEVMMNISETKVRLVILND